MGHPDKYIEANPLVTPSHIVPEWYFLPFYAILRSIPNKLLGVIAMALAIVIFLLLPTLAHISDRKFFLEERTSYVYENLVHPFLTLVFFLMFLFLGWLGAKPVEEPYVTMGAVSVFIYFFLIFFSFFWAKILFYKVKDLDPSQKVSNRFTSRPTNQTNNGKFKSDSNRLNFLSDLLLLNISHPLVFNTSFILYSGKSILILFLITALILCLLLLFISFFLSSSIISTKDLENARPFECGFNPFTLNPSSKLAFTAFKIALIFLLFDLEVIYLVPWAVSLKFFLFQGFFFYFFSGIPFLFFVFFGIIFEYVHKAVDWNFFNF